MHYLDLTLPGAADNLALDEALLLSAEEGSGGEVLRLWEHPDLVAVLARAANCSKTLMKTPALPAACRFCGGPAAVVPSCGAVVA